MIFLVEAFSCVTLLFSAFGQLERLEFMNGKINMYLFEIPMVISFLLLLAYYKLEPFKTVRFHELSGSVKLLSILMGAILLVSCYFFSGIANIVALLYFIRLLTYLLFMLYFFYFCSRQKKLPLLNGTVWGYIIMAILSGLVQYFYYPDLRNLFYDGWDPHYFRLFGTYFEPVIAAAVYGIILIFAVTANRLNLALRVFVGVIMAGMLVATFSRAAWIALILTALIYAARTKAIKIVVGAIIGAGLIFVLLPKPSGEGVNILRTSTVFSRLTDYQEGLVIWQKSPVFGIGYNHIPVVKIAPQVDSSMPNHAAGSLHSSFIIILATSGIIGLVFFLNWVFQLGRVSEFMKYALIFICVSSIFDNVLLHPFVLVALAAFGAWSANRLSRT